MKYFIDANIFLELQLDGKYAEECAILLRRIEKEEVEAVISDFLIYAIILAVEKFGNIKKIERFLESVLLLKGLEIIRPSFSELVEAVKTMEKYKLNFDDALIVACMKKRKINNLVSYDKHLEKVKEIKFLRSEEV